MAPQQPLRSQPHAAQHPEPLDRLVRVSRTRRLIPAGAPKQHRQIRFVAVQRKQRRTHRVPTGFPFQLYASFPSSRTSSSVSGANAAVATLLFGCITMSHPAGISCRWQRTISRKRRRMRLRTAAPPSAFLMLKPKRLKASSFERTNTVKWVLEERFPARYTASKLPRRTSRASRGKPKSAAGAPSLLRREAMTSLLAACRKHFAAALRLHAHAKSVGLRAAPAPRLKCTLWQSNPPLSFYVPAARSITSSPLCTQAQPYCGLPGSCRNYLVYPRPAPSVNKPPLRSPRRRFAAQFLPSRLAACSDMPSILAANVVLSPRSYP